MQLDHEARRVGIGASEIAAVLGLSTYTSPYDLWLLKTGQAQPDVEEETDAQIFGNLLEDVIAREYARRNNCKVQKVKGMIFSKDYPWLFCSPDRKRVGAQINIQVKTAGMFARGWGEEETDNIPPAYLVQVQQEMIVTGLPVTHIPVLVAGQKYRQYEVKADKNLQEIIIVKSREFWQCVTANVPPPATTLADAARQYPGVQGVEIYADDAIAALCEQVREAQARKKEFEQIESEGKAAIGNFMRSADTLTYGGVTLATWKSSTTTRCSTTRVKADYPDVWEACSESSESRTLLLKKPK